LQKRNTAALVDTDWWNRVTQWLHGIQKAKDPLRRMGL